MANSNHHLYDQKTQSPPLTENGDWGPLDHFNAPLALFVPVCPWDANVSKEIIDVQQCWSTINASARVQLCCFSFGKLFCRCCMFLNPTQGEGAPPPFDISTDGLRVRACLNETDSPDLSVPLMIPLIIRGMFCLLGAISHSLLSCTYCLHTSNGSSTAMFFWWIPTYN